MLVEEDPLDTLERESIDVVLVAGDLSDPHLPGRLPGAQRVTGVETAHVLFCTCLRLP